MWVNWVKHERIREALNGRKSKIVEPRIAADLNPVDVEI